MTKIQIAPSVQLWTISPAAPDAATPSPRVRLEAMREACSAAGGALYWAPTRTYADVEADRAAWTDASALGRRHQGRVRLYAANLFEKLSAAEQLDYLAREIETHSPSLVVIDDLQKMLDGVALNALLAWQCDFAHGEQCRFLNVLTGTQ